MKKADFCYICHRDRRTPLLTRYSITIDSVLESKPGTFFFNFLQNIHSLLSVYSLDCWLDDRCSIPGRNRDFFFPTITFKLAVGPTQPPIQLLTGNLSPGVNAAGASTHLHLVSRSCTSTFSYIMAWCLIKNKDNFTTLLFFNIASFW